MWLAPQGPEAVPVAALREDGGPSGAGPDAHPGTQQGRALGQGGEEERID